jgi:hypothetical protein
MRMVQSVIHCLDDGCNELASRDRVHGQYVRFYNATDCRRLVNRPGCRCSAGKRIARRLGSGFGRPNTSCMSSNSKNPHRSEDRRLFAAGVSARHIAMGTQVADTEYFSNQTNAAEGSIRVTRKCSITGRQSTRATAAWREAL